MNGTHIKKAVLTLAASGAFFWSIAAVRAQPAAMHGASHKHARLTAGAPGARGGAGQSSGWVDLSQDSASGAGFYPLPQQYRNGALQTRQRRALQYANNPIRAAIASEEIGYDFDEGYAFGHGHGVFDPDDGYGTPFFAGYYNNR
jgi:hypothetical protein